MNIRSILWSSTSYAGMLRLLCYCPCNWLHCTIEWSFSCIVWGSDDGSPSFKLLVQLVAFFQFQHQPYISVEVPAPFCVPNSQIPLRLAQLVIHSFWFALLGQSNWWWRAYWGWKTGPQTDFIGKYYFYLLRIPPCLLQIQLDLA